MPFNVARQKLCAGWQSFIWSPNHSGAQALHPAVWRQAAHCLHKLAPCEVYPASPVARRSGELLPRLFTLIPNARDGLFSVALSIRPEHSGTDLPVRKHSACWCSDFPLTYAEASESRPRLQSPPTEALAQVGDCPAILF